MSSAAARWGSLHILKDSWSRCALAHKIVENVLTATSAQSLLHSSFFCVFMPDGSEFGAALGVIARQVRFGVSLTHFTDTSDLSSSRVDEFTLREIYLYTSSGMLFFLCDLTAMPVLHIYHAKLRKEYKLMWVRFRSNRWFG